VGLANCKTTAMAFLAIIVALKNEQHVMADARPKKDCFRGYGDLRKIVIKSDRTGGSSGKLDWGGVKKMVKEPLTFHPRLRGQTPEW